MLLFILFYLVSTVLAIGLARRFNLRFEKTESGIGLDVCFVPFLNSVLCMAICLMFVFIPIAVFLNKQQIVQNFTRWFYNK